LKSITANEYRKRLSQSLTHPKLIDVARAAGVSTASASRALAGHAGVKPELHARIIAAAARLGYRGNWAARALASKRSQMVGLLLEELPDRVLSGVLQGAARRLGESGYACLVTVPSEPTQRMTAIAGLLGRGVEAVVFAGIPPRGQEIDALAVQAVPWIVIAEEDTAGDPRRIELGRAAGGELAARYLFELGHERLAVAAQGAGCARGVAKAVAGHDATLTQANISDSDPSAVRLALCGLLDPPRRPTAILCESDADALMALRECTLRGIRVPEEISIIGFGDEGFARHTIPALTSIRCPPTEIGLRAAQAVLARLGGPACESYKPPIKLVIRESTGPAP
jgi:DNA-binding LacI/PurR family transcriptional regulator